MTDEPEKNLDQDKHEIVDDTEYLEELEYLKDMEDLPKDSAVYVRMPYRYRQLIPLAAKSLNMSEAKFVRIALTATANEILRRRSQQENPEHQENSDTETKTEENP